MNRMDEYILDHPSTHGRDISVECDQCKTVFDVALARDEEFSDLRADERPECGCGEPDLGVVG